SITFDGETTGDITTFTVDGLTSIVVLGVAAEHAPDAATPNAIAPQASQTNAPRPTPFLAQNVFNAGDPIRLYIDIFNNVADEESANFSWAVFDPWNRLVVDFYWEGALDSGYGLHWWCLERIIPDVAISGE